MKLSDSFSRYINDEFPPKHVFCSYNGSPHSIILSEIEEYEYHVTGIDPTLNLPIVLRS
jgi:hypothetical protein